MSDIMQKIKWYNKVTANQEEASYGDWAYCPTWEEYGLTLAFFGHTQESAMAMLRHASYMKDYVTPELEGRFLKGFNDYLEWKNKETK